MCIINKMLLVKDSKQLMVLLAYIYLNKLNNRNEAVVILNELKINIKGPIDRFRVDTLEFAIQRLISEESTYNGFQNNLDHFFKVSHKESGFREILYLLSSNILRFWRLIRDKDKDGSKACDINDAIA